MTIDTLQQLFEQSITKIIAQGKRAIMDGRCVYKTSDGAGCVIGVLIPNEVYDPKIESNSVGSIIDNHITDYSDSDISKYTSNPKPLADWLAQNKAFCQNNRKAISWLQSLHDCVQNWKSEEIFIDAVHEYAKEFGLGTDFLSKLDFSNFEWENCSE